MVAHNPYLVGVSRSPSASVPVNSFHPRAWQQRCGPAEALFSRAQSDLQVVLRYWIPRVEGAEDRIQMLESSLLEKIVLIERDLSTQQELASSVPQLIRDNERRIEWVQEEGKVLGRHVFDKLEVLNSVSCQILSLEKKISLLESNIQESPSRKKDLLSAISALSEKVAVLEKDKKVYASREIDFLGVIASLTERVVALEREKKVYSQREGGWQERVSALESQVVLQEKTWAQQFNLFRKQLANLTKQNVTTDQVLSDKIKALWKHVKENPGPSSQMNSALEKRLARLEEEGRKKPDQVFTPSVPSTASTGGETDDAHSRTSTRVEKQVAAKIVPPQKKVVSRASKLTKQDQDDLLLENAMQNRFAQQDYDELEKYVRSSATCRFLIYDSTTEKIIARPMDCDRIFRELWRDHQEDLFQALLALAQKGQYCVLRRDQNNFISFKGCELSPPPGVVRTVKRPVSV